MLTVTLQTLGLQAAIEQAGGFSQRRMNAAIATALTRSAREARDAIKAEMPRVLDRPTPYTLRGVFFSGANATSLKARVWVNEESGAGIPQNRFLGPQVYGGGRNVKRFEKALQARGAMPGGMYAVPTRAAKRDAYGNMASGQLAQIVSQVGTELVSGHNRTLRRRAGETDQAWAARKRKAMGKAGGQVVAIPKQRGKLKPGIYLAEGRDFGRMGFGRSGRLKPLLLFKPSVRYNERVPFYATAQATAERAFPKHLSDAVMASAARLAASRGA